MEWNETEEMNNDRCSTASSTSNSAEMNCGILLLSNTSQQMAKRPLPNGNHTVHTNGNTPANLDSMSDGELSDFSLNDSDEEVFRSPGNTGEYNKIVFYSNFIRNHRIEPCNLFIIQIAEKFGEKNVQNE